ncbi:transporter substrate-binding domain-containing protein [Shewanella sp. 202IG2-18]|uniref:transporter substrate-binding domain-containing protein n=1 Tax=Parashewanella hymeniacidonis TaxID=2807618 RepID=UPI001960D74E|nr:transporter substrate-binding domain-containing protein [Parashewanella hymeniacidonis]MBM7073128.1 transporter substrate-binding domain-containing protein [Parashewanella hymeniacidonis]
MKTFIRLSALIFCSFISFLSVCKESPLIIAVGNDSFPFQYQNDVGNADGYLVDLWKEWSKSTDTPIEFRVANWPESLELVENGTADVHAGMASTRPREVIFEFGEPLANVSAHLYVHHLADHVSTLEDVSGYAIGIVQESAHQALLSKLIPEASFKVFDSRTSLLDAATKGDILIFAGLNGYLRERSRQFDITGLFPYEKRIKISEIPLQIATSKRKASSLSKINEGFSQLTDASIREIKQRWIGFDSHHVAGISVALSKDNEPFSEFGANGIPHGLYIDLWRAWSQAAKTKVNFVFYDKDESLTALKEGDIEVVIADPSSLNDSELINAWKLNDVKHRLFIHSDKNEKIDTFDNLKIGVLEGVNYYEDLKKALNKSNIVVFKSVTNMMQASIEGNLDGFIAAAAATQHKLLINEIWSEFFQVPDVEYSSPNYVVIQRGNDGLKRKLVEGYNRLPYNQLSEIEKKWVLNPADQVHLVSDTILTLSANQIDFLEKLPVLKLGYLKSWAPLEFQDENGHFNGINADVIEHIKTHLKLKIRPIAYDTWPQLLNALKTGDVDIVGSVAKSNDREKSFEFSSSYWPTSWAIVSRFEHAGLFSLNQLSNLKVALVNGYDVKDKLLSISPSIKIIPVDNTQSGVEAVANGKADIFINKLMTLASLMKSEGYHDLNLSLLPEISMQQSHFGVNPKYNELIPLLNIALDQLDQTKKQDIYLKWVPGANLSEHYKYRRWMAYLSVILAIVTLSFLTYWRMNNKVQRERVKRHKVEQRIQYLNTHDNLTGLLNRRLLDDRLTSAVLTHSREQTRFAVMFIGLDNFKLVNEMKGYSHGDELLVAVANALAGTIRKSDTLARFGSDEFVIVLNRAQEFDAVCQVAENALVALNRVIEAQVPDVPVTASIGVAFYPMDADNPIELLKQADKLMQLAKDNPENSYMTS